MSSKDAQSDIATRFCTEKRAGEDFFTRKPPPIPYIRRNLHLNCTSIFYTLTRIVLLLLCQDRNDQ